MNTIYEQELTNIPSYKLRIIFNSQLLLLLQQIINTIVDAVSGLGYIGIVLLMFLESSFFPFPSEIVMIPAGYLAYQGEMNFFIAIIMGIIGSILGALFNYVIAVKLGRPFIRKYGKWFFLSEENFKKVEIFFTKHGEISTFIGRLLPGIRQYISFPAGIALMNTPKFCFYTGLGAGIWVTILTYIGFAVGGNEGLVKEYSKEALIVLLIGACFILGIYVWKAKRKNAT